MRSTRPLAASPRVAGRVSAASGVCGRGESRRACVRRSPWSCGGGVEGLKRERALLARSERRNARVEEALVEGVVEALDDVVAPGLASGDEDRRHALSRQTRATRPEPPRALNGPPLSNFCPERARRAAARERRGRRTRSHPGRTRSQPSTPPAAGAVPEPRRHRLPARHVAVAAPRHAGSRGDPDAPVVSHHASTRIREPLSG